VGRGDWEDVFILNIEIILNFKILLISFLAKEITVLIPSPHLWGEG
jgi:hypothetical protein